MKTTTACHFERTECVKTVEILVISNGAKRSEKSDFQLKQPLKLISPFGRNDQNW